MSFLLTLQVYLFIIVVDFAVVEDFTVRNEVGWVNLRFGSNDIPAKKLILCW
jgi:hypothetical protein